jgi:hypothetical protein
MNPVSLLPHLVHINFFISYIYIYIYTHNILLFMISTSMSRPLFIEITQWTFFQKLKPSGSLNLGCDLLGLTLCSLIGDYWFRGTCWLIPSRWRLQVSLKHLTIYQIVQCQPSRMQYKFSPPWQPKISDFCWCTTVFSLLFII